MAKSATSPSFPAMLRVSGKATSLRALIEEAIAAGMPIALPNNGQNPELHGEFEDSSAIDPSLTLESGSAPPPQIGTSYGGLSPAQRQAFLAWSHKPENSAPPAYQQLYLANLEARLLEPAFTHIALEQLQALADVPMWRANLSFHRTQLLACWLAQDGPRLVDWIGKGALPADLLGIAFGLQALMQVPLAAIELGTAISTWKLGARLPSDLLKLRLDSLTSILGQPPLAYALARLDAAAIAPRPWRTAHRGLRLLIPQPDLRAIMEPSLRDVLAVADVDDEDVPIGNLATLDTSQPVTSAEQDAQEAQPSLEELGWRLILEFGSNRSEYFDYVLIQAQKLTGYSQIMDEDRRIVYRIIFRKSEMRRFWRIWDYVHGWTSTRVYLHGVELEKWKVWPYSQYLR